MIVQEKVIYIEEGNFVYKITEKIEKLPLLIDLTTEVPTIVVTTEQQTTPQLSPRTCTCTRTSNASPGSPIYDSYTQGTASPAYCPEMPNY